MWCTVNKFGSVQKVGSHWRVAWRMVCEPTKLVAFPDDVMSQAFSDGAKFSGMEILFRQFDDDHHSRPLTLRASVSLVPPLTDPGV